MYVDSCKYWKRKKVALLKFDWRKFCKFLKEKKLSPEEHLECRQELEFYLIFEYLNNDDDDKYNTRNQRESLQIHVKESELQKCLHFTHLKKMKFS